MTPTLWYLIRDPQVTGECLKVTDPPDDGPLTVGREVFTPIEEVHKLGHAGKLGEPVMLASKVPLSQEQVDSILGRDLLFRPAKPEEDE